MARRRSYRTPVPAKRRMFWVRQTLYDYPGDGNGNARAHNLLAAFEEEYGAQLFGFTVTRIRGHLQIWASGADDASLPYWASAGIRVADDAAVEQADTDTEAASLLPMSDKHADWMWQTNVMVQSTTGEANVQRWASEIDVKAQRRIDELGQGLYLFNGNLDIDSPPVAYTFDLSVLMKRP